MAAISDLRHELCLGLALWNGKDPILKERMFGLTGPEGNHGEDAKDYWWYLEGLPSHALLKWRYHYPQDEFPYRQLVEHGRGLGDPELELLDTGVFDDDRYWSVEVTYAKATATDIGMRIVLENHGDAEATIEVCRPVVPQHLVVGGRCPPPAHRPRRPVPARGRPRAGRVPAGCRSRPRRGGSRGAVLRERDQSAACLRRSVQHAVPEGRQHQRPRRHRGGDREPGRHRHQGGAALPGDRPRRGHGRAAPTAAPPGRAVGHRGGLGGNGIRRPVQPARGGCRRVLLGAGAAGHDPRGDAGAAPGLGGPGVEQADVPLRRRALARR